MLANGENIEAGLIGTVREVHSTGRLGGTKRMGRGMQADSCIRCAVNEFRSTH